MIDSAGYGGDIDTVQWAQLQPLLAARYGVQDSASCQVEPYTTGTYQVQVSTGFAGGWGVVDQITATELYTLPNPASGTQYFLVGLLRDWSAKTTTVSHILAGASLPASMPGRPQDPGNTQDFQPLALVSLAHGDTAPKIVYDLRAAGGPNTFNMSAALATLPNWLAYMAFEGNTIWTGHKRWHRAINAATGNPFWDVSPEIVHSGPGLGNGLSISNAGTAGWKSYAVLECRGSRNDNDMKIFLQINHYSGSNPVSFTSQTGNTVGGDVTVLVVGNTDWQPPYDIPAIAFDYLAADNSSLSGFARYNTDGSFAITNGVQGTSIGVRSDGSWSIQALISWTRES